MCVHPGGDVDAGPVHQFLALVFTKRAERTETKVDDQLVPFIKDLLIVLVVILSGLIIVGQVFNIDIATLVAGLGIGGIAIALAAKETLENLLASFTILVDGSFVVGDAVQIGQTTEDVEKIGFPEYPYPDSGWQSGNRAKPPDCLTNA